MLKTDREAVQGQPVQLVFSLNPPSLHPASLTGSRGKEEKSYKINGWEGPLVRHNKKGTSVRMLYGARTLREKAQIKPESAFR